MTKRSIIIITPVIIIGWFTALPIHAQLGETVNKGLSYGTIVGWGTQDLRTAIMMIINILMGFLGIAAVLIILASGLKFIASGGNEEKMAEARRSIFSGIIGLAIIIGAFAIASFIMRSLTEVTGT